MPTKRERIAEDLRRQILDGTYPPDARLPTEDELKSLYGVSRGTVRDAVELLEYSGLVESRAGRYGGTFVRNRVTVDIFAWRDDAPMSTSSEHDLFFSTVREQGFEPSQEFKLRIEPLPEEYARLLHVEPGSPAAVRRCVRYVDDIPHSIQDSWYPDWLVAQVPRLRDPNDIPQGTTRLLADEGFVQVAAFGATTAFLPTADERHHLRIPASRPVLRNVLTGYTRDQPLRISTASFDSHKTRLVSAHGQMEIIVRFRP